MDIVPLGGDPREIDRSSYNAYFPIFNEIFIVPTVADTGNSQYPRLLGQSRPFRHPT